MLPSRTLPTAFVLVVGIGLLASMAAAQTHTGPYSVNPPYISNNRGYVGPSPYTCIGENQYVDVFSTTGDFQSFAKPVCKWGTVSGVPGNEVGASNVQIISDTQIRCPTPFETGLGQFYITVEWPSTSFEVPIYLTGGYGVTTSGSSLSFSESDSTVTIKSTDSLVDIQGGIYGGALGEVLCRFYSAGENQTLETQVSGNTINGDDTVTCTLPPWKGALGWDPEVASVSVQFSFDNGCRFSDGVTMSRTFNSLTLDPANPITPRWRYYTNSVGCHTITTLENLQVDGPYPQCVLRSAGSFYYFAPNTVTTNSVTCCNFNYNDPATPSLAASFDLRTGPNNNANLPTPDANLYWSAGLDISASGITTPASVNVVQENYSTQAHYTTPKIMTITLNGPVSESNRFQYGSPGSTTGFDDPVFRFQLSGKATRTVTCVADAVSPESRCSLPLPDLETGIWSIQGTNDGVQWANVGTGSDQDLTVVPLPSLTAPVIPTFESISSSLGADVDISVTGSNFVVPGASYRTVKIALADPANPGVPVTSALCEDDLALDENPPRCVAKIRRDELTQNVLFDAVVYNDDYQVANGDADELPTSTQRYPFVVRPEPRFAVSNPIEPDTADYAPTPGSRVRFNMQDSVFSDALDVTPDPPYSDISVRFSFRPSFQPAYPAELIYFFDSEPSMTLIGTSAIEMDIPTISDPLAIGEGRVIADVDISYTSISGLHYTQASSPFSWTVTPSITDFPNAQSGINGETEVAFVCTNCYAGLLDQPLNVKFRMLGDLGKDPLLSGDAGCHRDKGPGQCPCGPDNVDSDYNDFTDEVGVPDIIPCADVAADEKWSALASDCTDLDNGAVIAYTAPNWGVAEDDICFQISVNTGLSWSQTNNRFSYIREIPADLQIAKPNPEPGSCPVGATNCQIRIKGSGFNSYSSIGYENTTCNVATDCEPVDPAPPGGLTCDHPACIFWDKDPTLVDPEGNFLEYVAPVWDRATGVPLHTSNDDLENKAFPEEVSASPLPAENFIYYDQVEFTLADINPSRLTSSLAGQLLVIGGDTSNLGVENSNYRLVIGDATEASGIPALDQLQPNRIIFHIPDLEPGFYPLSIARNGQDFVGGLGGDVIFTVENRTSTIEEFDPPLDVDSIVGVILIIAIFASAASCLVAISIISYRRGFSSTAATVASQLAVSKDPEADPLTGKTDDIEQQIAKTKEKLGRVKEKKDALKVQKQENERALRQAEKERIQKKKEEMRAAAEAEKSGKGPSRIALAVVGGTGAKSGAGSKPGAASKPPPAKAGGPGARPGNARRPSQGRAGSQSGPGQRRPSQGRAGSQSRPGQGRAASKERPKPGAGPNRAGKPSNPPPRGGGGGARRPSQGRPKSPARPKK